MVPSDGRDMFAVNRISAPHTLDTQTLRGRLGLNRRGACDFLDALVAPGMLDREDDLHRDTRQREPRTPGRGPVDVQPHGLAPDDGPQMPRSTRRSSVGSPRRDGTGTPGQAASTPSARASRTSLWR